MRHRFWLVVLVGTILAAGCDSSSSGLPKGSKVQGKVTYNGNPVAGAKVIFTDGKDAAGMPSGPAAVTDESGEYAAVGVPPGTYKVVVFKLLLAKGSTLSEDQLDLEQIEASGAGTHALPAKYAKSATTTLTAEVTSGANKDVNFELKGK